MAAFWSYPAPLALADQDGHPTLCNSMFLKRFGPAGMDPAALAALAEDPSGTWQDPPVALGTPGGPRARALRTPHGVLVIVEDEGDSMATGLLGQLQSRVNELESLVATDHLTGAWSRAHLDVVLAGELARHGAARQPVSLILLDIDHFKNVNDTYGHAVGDIVLRELVAVARANARTSDQLFRWGGEEFVILVASAGYRRAETVAEHLRQVIADHVFEAVGRVTVSLGVAEHDGDENADAWFRRLDAALYEAKESGRNRVVVARRGDSDTWAAGGGAGALNLVWQEGYECGEPMIDAEHRELFRLANRLIHAASGKQQDQAAVGAALDEVIDHVRMHFADEEALLERLGYAGLPEHRRIHAGLLRRAANLKARVESGQAKLGAVVEFLALDVVVRHLTSADRAFFPLFRTGPA